MSEFIEQIKPEKDGIISQDEIDKFLGYKPDKVGIEYPKCKACGKEFYYFFGRNLPEKYDGFCDSCVKKQVQQVSDEEELLSLYKSLGEHCSYYLTPEQCHIAWQLHQDEEKSLEHKKYFDEIKNLYDQAFYLSTKHKTSVDFEFYALLLQRIDKTIEKNSYKSDPRNIVFK